MRSTPPCHDASMAFAVELTLDRESAGPVRALWGRMADGGIQFMADSNADPHITLGIWESLDIQRTVAEVAALANLTAPVPLVFADVQVFGTEVVYLAPTRSTRLADLHRHVHERIGPLGDGAWPYYTAAAWVPHCTVAMELGLVPIATALNIATGIVLPLSGRGDRIAIVEFRPARERYTHLLTGH